MPWNTPTLDQLRAQNRDNVTSKLRSGPMIPNSVLRVMSDGNAGLAYLTLLYLDWLAKQLMPDTAESEWLVRFVNIWLGGPKTATFAVGVANVTGIQNETLPDGAQYTVTTLLGPVVFQTTQQITVGSGPTPVNIVALTAGRTGLDIGAGLNLATAVSGIDGSASLASLTDGVDAEMQDEMRARLLDRIRQPPMGGDAEDYVQWALEVPGVTRAWCSPNEMGIGTVTVRFMMDDKNAGPLVIDTNGQGHGAGFPETSDVATVLAHLQTKRPVALKDFFVEAPIPYQINFTVKDLELSDAATQAAIAVAVAAMLLLKAAPAYALNGVAQAAQTIFAVWVSDAVLSAAGVESFDLVMTDQIMPNNGSLAVLGTVSYTYG